MATAIINSQMDAINESFSKILSDLTTIRPLLKNAAIGAFPTDSASGSIASFIDGAEDVPVKSLSVDIEPVQNLNGYDNPWPAGGGKNLCPNIIQNNVYSGVTVSIVGDKFHFSGTSTATGGRTYLQTSAFTLPAGTYYLSSDYNYGTTPSIQVIVQNASTSAVIKDRQNASSFTLSEDTSVRVGFNVVSGNTYNNTVYVQIEAGSTATTYAPYSNVCPISGHDSVNVYRTGVNVWDGEWEVGNIDAQSGVNTANNDIWRTTNYIPILPNTTYYCCCPSVGIKAMRPRFYDANKNYIGYTPKSGAVQTTKTFVPPDGAYFMRFCPYISEIPTHDISINYPSTDTEYHAYTGQTYNVSLGQTVYGGTLNVTAGVLAINMGIVDLGTLTWTKASAGYFAANKSDLKFVAGGVIPNLISSAYRTVTPNQAYNNAYDLAISTAPTYSAIFVRDSRYSDAATFKTAVSGVQCCYELATPTTVQLTPTQVSTLLGANNIWSDAGSVSVLYRADVGLYIDKKLAQALNA